MILVSGGGGWLGSRLVRLLGREGPVRVLLMPGQDESVVGPPRPGLQIARGDLTREEDCRAFCEGAGGGLLFHCAGIIHPRRVRDFYRVNVQATSALLEASARAGVRRAVVVSSNSPCGCNPHPDHVFDELSPYRPYMNYGRSKMEMELAVRGFHERGELETVLVRAPWFYGPNQPKRQTSFFRLIRRGLFPILGSGESLRSMAYVDNLCQGLQLAASTPAAAGRIYWIADARPYPMNEIVETVRRVLSRDFKLAVRPRTVRLPAGLGILATLGDWLIQKTGFYSEKVHVLSELNKTIACSIQKARLELGYAPAIDLEEGMRRSVGWCLENGLEL